MIKKIYNLLTPTERRKSLLILLMVLVMAFLDVLGVASIMPFMAVVASPEMIDGNIYLSSIYKFIGFTEPQQFLFFLGVAVFVLLLASISFKALTTWELLRFASMCHYSLGKRLVTGYLYQPYEWYLNRHTADLGKTVLSEAGQVIHGALMPLMKLIAHAVVVIALIGLLLVIEPMLTVYIGMTLGVAYVGIYVFLRKPLVHLGDERLKANRVRFQSLTEAFSGIKEVKFGGLEEAFIHRFDGPSERFANADASAQAAAQLPRFFIEILIFGGMLIVVLYLISTSGGIQGALPLIALYAFAGYRLMPALQQVFANLSNLRYAGPALDNLHKDIINLEPLHKRPEVPDHLKIEHSIKLQNISYSYPNAARAALTGLDLEIAARTTIGIVGRSGAGKTTLVDITLGLLQAQHGKLCVDGKPISGENIRAWQKSIGYVPQQIYLSDDTIAANIAFGVDKRQIDQGAVEKAARIANLHEFVTTDLPEGYNTPVGDRGIRLSGGQRQRIGIARALYHNPQILILDEATSALDNLTEQVVMDAVHNLNHEITIIIITHRLTTVRECDWIYLLEKGELAGQGAYDKLIENSWIFREMAQAI